MKKKEQMTCEMKTWTNALMYLSYNEHERKSQDQELEVEMHMKQIGDNECLQMISEKYVKERDLESYLIEKKGVIWRRS